MNTLGKITAWHVAHHCWSQKRGICVATLSGHAWPFVGNMSVEELAAKFKKITKSVPHTFIVFNSRSLHHTTSIFASPVSTWQHLILSWMLHGNIQSAVLRVACQMATSRVVVQLGRFCWASRLACQSFPSGYEALSYQAGVFGTTHTSNIWLRPCIAWKVLTYVYENLYSPTAVNK